MKILLAVCCFLSAVFTPAYPDAAEITNLVSSQSSHNFVVEYDLLSDIPVMVNIDVTVQGVTYPQSQLSLEGDVAKPVRPGKGRKFIWNAKRDFPKWPDIEVTVSSKPGHPR